MNVTQTTPHISTPGPKPRFLLIYALIPMVLFALLLGILGVVSSSSSSSSSPPHWLYLSALHVLRFCA